MQPALAPTTRYTYQEYLKFEERSDVRHEWFAGEIFAMAGGSGAHAVLKSNLHGAVFAALRGKPCQPRDADQRVVIPETGLATYPDLSIVCGKRIPHPDDRHALTNPTVLFEVLSPTSAGYDGGQKFDHYKQLGTLRQYVLVDSEHIHISLFTRDELGRWIQAGLGAGAMVNLESAGITISVDELYQGWAEERAIDLGLPWPPTAKSVE